VQDIIVIIQGHVGKLIIGLVKNGNMIKLIDILKEIKSNISLEMIVLYTQKSNSNE
jgi:hypothetical protein